MLPLTSAKVLFGDLDCIFKVTAVLCLNSGGSLKEYFSSLDNSKCLEHFMDFFLF